MMTIKNSNIKGFKLKKKYCEVVVDGLHIGSKIWLL